MIQLRRVLCISTWRVVVSSGRSQSNQRPHYDFDIFSISSAFHWQNHWKGKWLCCNYRIVVSLVSFSAKESCRLLVFGNHRFFYRCITSARWDTFYCMYSYVGIVLLRMVVKKDKSAYHLWKCYVLLDDFLALRQVEGCFFSLQWLVLRWDDDFIPLIRLIYNCLSNHITPSLSKGITSQHRSRCSPWTKHPKGKENQKRYRLLVTSTILKSFVLAGNCLVFAFERILNSDWWNVHFND